LLGDIFDIRVAAEHARHRPGDEALVPFDEFLEGAGITPAHQLHESHVFCVFRSACRFQVTGHYKP
jgi:hypothetical protein